MIGKYQRVSTDDVPIPRRYRYKPTPFKNYFKLINPVITADQWIVTVPSPTRKFLTELEIYGDIKTDDPTICPSLIPCVNLIQEHFMKEGRLEINAALRIIRDAGDLFQSESTILELNRPITFVGDICGQYYDLLALLKLGGCLDRFTYLFLGNYVDGGYFGTECFIQLCAMKLKYNKKIYLLRGNHDTRLMTKLHLFKKECELKYNIEFYDECMLTFDKLPLAALIENRFLCVHGGISPNITTLDDIRKLNRYCEPELNTIIFDILWSDPLPDYDKNMTTDSYQCNLQRGGASYYYTYSGLKKFLKNNNLNALIRGHEMKMDGFKCYLQNECSSMPTLITIFSAPNYHDLYGNKGTIIQYENCNFTIKQFASMCHPYWYPNFYCALELTIPYIAEKVTNMLLALLMNCVEGGTDDMYMPEMRQSRKDAICCKHSDEFDKIIELKKSIRNVCRISAFYCNIKDKKLSFITRQRNEEDNFDDGELKVIGKNKKKSLPVTESLSKVIIDD